MNKKINRLCNKKVAIVGSVENNKPFVKAMLVTKHENNCIFYFASNMSSNRVSQFLKNSNACVYFYGGIIYNGVMLEGTMEVLSSDNIKKQFWKKSMSHVYKKGVTDPDYCILKFTANKGRYYRMFKSYDFNID